MIPKAIVCIIAGLGAGIGTGAGPGSPQRRSSPLCSSPFSVFPPMRRLGSLLPPMYWPPRYRPILTASTRTWTSKTAWLCLAAVLLFTVVGSFVAKLVPNTTMGGFSVFMTLLLGIKFIVRPVMTTKERLEHKTIRQKVVQSILCGIVVGFICGFVGAGGGMMMLLVLTSVLGYELKTAVGTSVFIMTFTAFTGAATHMAIGGMPDLFALAICILATLAGARGSALFANKADARTLNRITGVVLAALGAAMLMVKLVT